MRIAIVGGALALSAAFAAFSPMRVNAKDVVGCETFTTEKACTTGKGKQQGCGWKDSSCEASKVSKKPKHHDKGATAAKVETSVTPDNSGAAEWKEEDPKTE